MSIAIIPERNYKLLGQSGGWETKELVSRAIRSKHEQDFVTTGCGGPGRGERGCQHRLWLGRLWMATCERTEKEEYVGRGR